MSGITECRIDYARGKYWVVWDLGADEHSCALVHREVLENLISLLNTSNDKIRTLEHVVHELQFDQTLFQLGETK
jgi:molybdopterin-guanine dinucleotide biosynthesis protein A